MSKIEKNREPVIVAAARTAVGKAKRGTLATFRPDEMGAEVIRELLRRAPALDPADIEDVILGSSCPEGEQGMNMARLVALVCRSSHHRACRNAYSLLLFRPADDCPCCLCHHGRPDAGSHFWRRGIDEHDTNDWL